MKYLLLFVAISLVSCHKCYQCTTETNYPAMGFAKPVSSKTTAEVCGMTKKQAKDYEQAGTDQYTNTTCR